MDRDRKAERGLRLLLLVVLLLGLLGTGVELLLVGHTETFSQYAPVVLIALALPALAWTWRGSAASVRIWQVLMALFVVSGLVGLPLHWNAKIEFTREVNPSLPALQLYWQAMKTQSPPALAPGIMIQIGLLGLAYAWGRPEPAVEAGGSEKDRGGTG